MGAWRSQSVNLKPVVIGIVATALTLTASTVWALTDDPSSLTTPAPSPSGTGTPPLEMEIRSSHPIAYWPLNETYTVASGLVGGPALVADSARKEISFGATAGPVGAQGAYPELTTDANAKIESLRASVPGMTSTWTVDVIATVDPTGHGGNFLTWTAGDSTTWGVGVVETDGMRTLYVNAYTGEIDGPRILASAPTSFGDDQWHHIRVESGVKGSSTWTRYYVDDVLLGQAQHEDLPTGAVRHVAILEADPGYTVGASIGHVAVYDGCAVPPMAAAMRQQPASSSPTPRPTASSSPTTSANS